MQQFLNTVLKYLKWPMALLMVLMFLPALNADVVLVKSTVNAKFFVHFIAPVLGMIAIWFVVPGLNGSHLAIFEHEFTHMIAALLTFHRPKSMKIDPDHGGSVWGLRLLEQLVLCHALHQRQSPGAVPAAVCAV